MAPSTSIIPQPSLKLRRANAGLTAKPDEATSEDVAPYTKELQAVKMPANIIAGWQQLYEQCLQANATSPTNASTNSSSPHSVIPQPSLKLRRADAGLTAKPDEATSVGGESSPLNPLFSINFFTLIANYLDPKKFVPFENDPLGKIHFNYATVHLRDAVTRLGFITSIVQQNGMPTVDFTGDCRDMGIIVNLQNNTDATFSVNQISLDGKTSTQIGQISPGLNELNLHTAALQTPFVKSAAKTTNNASTTPLVTAGSEQESKSEYFFQFEEIGAENPTQISIKLYSGTDLVTFLESLPRKNKDEVEMNGLPTSPEYLANPKDWYMVLIQNPPAPDATTPNPDQRIQAINISKLSGPYLLSMQLNQESVEITPAKGKTPAIMMKVFQPSLTTALEVKNKFATMTDFPLIILPQFLWTLPQLQAIWMLLKSSRIAALTDFKFFGPKTFGDAFEYFTNLGCFDMQNKYAFIIDLYNLLESGDRFHDASWLMASAIYETKLKQCFDFPQLHSSQDSQGKIIGNGTGFFYLNFQVRLHPQKEAIISSLDIFKRHGFNKVYAQSKYQLWTMLCSILTSYMKEGAFAELTEIQPGTYKVIWTNKKNEILNTQYLYMDARLSKIGIFFMNRDKNWKGSFVPEKLFQIKLGIKNDFNVTYESMPTENRHLLSIQPTSPIDKTGILHTTYIIKQPTSNHPISNLYYDLYETFQNSNFTRCYIIQDGNLPPFLSNLSIEDWQNGIYLIPSVKNHEYLSPSNPGVLIVTFYKSDKTLLGHIQAKRLYQNNSAISGIQQPVKFSTIYSDAFNPLFEGDLTSGILVKYPN